MLAGGKGLVRGQEPGAGFGLCSSCPGGDPSLVGYVCCGGIIGTDDLWNILVMTGPHARTRGAVCSFGFGASHW